MGVDNFFNTAVSGNRQAKRARVLLAAKLQTPHGEIEARLRDLSRKGALIECSPAPPTGSEVVFIRGPIAVPARVAWSLPGRVGLEFLYMIDENEVLVQMKRVGSAQSQNRFRRPGIKEHASDQERRLAAAWGVQVGINLPDQD
ncbi:MAG TPA: PilZ domain-containing protein [Allosphingosinicella sp.]|jgi:hypothetical protein